MFPPFRLEDLDHRPRMTLDRATSQIAEVITAKRGEMHATLLGELGVILDWLDKKPKTPNDNTPGRLRDGGVVIVGCGSRI
nr:hypothetical protein [uncultured Brevundimonas sp.]